MTTVGGILAAVLIFGVVATIYLVPTAVAVSRKHHNTVAIGVLNLLLGWSIVGWVVALVWAVSRSEPASRLKE